MRASSPGDHGHARPRGIGLVGCGWVASIQLAAYRDAGFSVVARTDHTPGKAERLRDAYYPDAVVHPDVASLLGDPAVQVVAIATHPAGRPALREQALLAGMPAFASREVLVLSDFGIHWFDLVGALLPGDARAVCAQVGRRAGQRVSAPTQARHRRPRGRTGLATVPGRGATC